MELIKGKIAAIKSDYAVVINKGYADGVEEDMRFIVFEEGEEINDPDTKESLGNLEYVKAKVKVTYPSERLSWAETYESYAVPGAGSAINSALATMSALVPKFERVKLPLDTTLPSSVTGSVKRNLNIGDSVRQIID